ncbi:MAG: DNA gyrase subunit A [Planctomycetes bacterium]|nr:DNA gyrase subunit A [Planctomycetota bacterium]
MPSENEAGIHHLLIEEEMKESYLTYAMSVLVDRALPDLRDGLKPVHRRILQSMRDLNLTATAKYQKSAKIVGHCLGNYHPHGDTSVYDAMVRMAQDFSLRYELVDGQGNFGSIDGDSAAAYRYTEARMSRVCAEMMEDIQYDTVDHRDNFDGQRQEPTVLPAKLPNLLVNGSSGIAVGMATNIPPHNLTEVCQAIIHAIENPACTVGDLMRFIKAPDFPTGATICGTAGIREAYEFGRGRVVMRAKIHQEEVRGKQCLVVTEIPYGIKLATIQESIVAADREEKLKGVAEMTGGAVGDGVRLVLELKRDADPDLVINQLWEHTNLQYNFAINMIALDGGRPRTVSLKRMCLAYVEHRKDVIVRKTRFLLARDEARLHIVEGLLKAIDIIDEIIRVIRAAASTDVAKAGLIGEFGFSDRQAQAILDMQLRRLTGLERDKLQTEHDDLVAAITDYKDILARDERQYAIIKADLNEMMEKYGDERRTVIVAAAGEFNMEDLIEDDPCVVTITNSGYIKRLTVDTFRLQKRGGKGVSGGSLKDGEDFVAQMFTATCHQYLLCFTNLGKVYWLKVYDIPEATRTARGRALVNVLSLEANERISEVIPVREFREDQFLLMATALGQVKKTALAAYGNPRAGGIKGIKLADDDALVDVVITSGNDEILIASDDGQACRFNEADCRPMGRDTSGVTGIELGSGARVVSLLRLDPGTEVLTICRSGFGKRTPFDEYRLTRRGGKGVINIDTSERNGPVVVSLSVAPGDELMLMSRGGTVVRTSVDEIRTTGRAAQGVKIINLDDGDILTGVARCPKEDVAVGGDATVPTPPAPETP